MCSFLYNDRVLLNCFLSQRYCIIPTPLHLSSQGRWLYALLACLEKPLIPEAHSLIRQLARRCSAVRANLVNTPLLFWDVLAQDESRSIPVSSLGAQVTACLLTT